MKKITLLVTICMVFISLNSFAQGMGGGMGGSMGGSMGGRSGGQGGRGGQGQGMPQQQQQQRSLEINFIGATGYFAIDTETALRKLKFKDNSPKAVAMVENINEFIASCQELITTHRKEIDILEFAKENLEAAEGDTNKMREIMMSVNESSRAVRPILIEHHKQLSESMTELLNEKELKRWTKFYESICNDNSFNPNPRERRQGPPDGERPEHPEDGDEERSPVEW